MNWRMNRVNSALKETAARFIEANLSIDKSVLSVTYLVTQPDLKKVTIGLVIFPRNDKLLSGIIRKIAKRNRELSYLLARSHNLKNIPEIEYLEDKNIDNVNKISELFQELDNESN